MTDLVEKTMGTLSTLFGSVGLGNDGKTKGKISSLWNFDKEMFVKRLKSAASKKEEETIVQNFLSFAEKQLSQPNVTEADVQTFVKLAMVCEALGFPTPFIYVHAIKLAQKGNLQEKHTGYLAGGSLLHPHHELVILLTNTIQKDLESSNYAEVLLGLKAVCNLINEDTVHNVLYIVQGKLTHENSEVRKVAAFTLGHCLKLVNSESAYKMVLPQLEKALTDTDLAVASAAISVLYNLVKVWPGDYEYLIPCFIQLQNQLLRGQIPDHMEYQNIAAPWLQIKILKFLTFLCRSPEQGAAVFPLLKATLQKAEINHQIAYAIIAEVIETIVSIEYNEEMVLLAVSAAGKLLKSESGNLKYMGVQAFTTIVQRTKPSLTPAQQASIMECLNHSDETLKLKTLQLLYHLVNPSNAKEICKRMVEYVISKKEQARKDLALQALEIANQYNKDSEWYISTVNTLLSEVDDVIPPEKISQIIDVICQDPDSDLKRIAKRTYLDMCRKSCPSSSLVKITCSVLDDPEEFEVILPYSEKLDSATSLWIFISLRNAVVKTKKSSQKLTAVLEALKITSKDVNQVRSETIHIINLFGSIGNLQLKDEVDVTLSHLDGYVCRALSNGLPCYKPQRLRVADSTVKSDFKYTGQHTSEVSSIISWDPNVEMKPLSPSKSLSYTSISSSSLPIQSQSSSELSYNSNIKNVWTKEGRIKEKEANRSDTNSPFEQVSDGHTEIDKLFAGVS